MVNFANMFKISPTPAPAPASGDNNNNNNNNPGDNKNLSDPNPPIGADGKIPGTDPTPVNPLDAYKKMYDTANASSDIHAPVFKLDPKVLSEVSATMDFTKNVNPELITKALAGDAKSLLEVMQAVGRNSYSASLEHATTLTETHLGQRADFEGKRVDAGVKKQLTTDALSTTAPNYDHPVVKAELNRVADMFARANPDASPQQIAKAAQKHITELSAALNPAAAKSDGNVDANGMDWSKYLNS